jgi:hypothetical protein
MAAVLLLSAGVASAGEARHPGGGTLAPPAGVPAGYVLTHSGWLHPSYW